MTKCIVTIILLVFIGCKDFGEDVRPVPPDVPVNVLLAAPETVVVDGGTLTLSTYMWRSFMPIVPPNGSSLIALVYIGMTDSTKVPSSTSADAVWIVNGQTVWKSFLADANQPPTNQLCKVARDGPQWDNPVDVIVRVFGSRGDSHLLRAPHQTIGKVY
jgi:hypothetical protein